ncbi:ABC transporter ATP-binding protein, partial [Clavibacter michiganensis]
DAVGLAHLAADRLATISGGELQRVALARALAQGAGHVLLDEPTNHLDIRHRLEVVGLMRRIAPTVVVVLHDLEAAAAACDHVVVIDRGRVAGAGSPRDVLRPELLDAVYGVRTTVIPDADGHPHLRFTLPAPGDQLDASIPLERTRP